MQKREILWIYGIEGGEGKTHLSDYLRLNTNAYLMGNDKKENTSYLYNKEKIIIINYVRDNEEKISYQQIEQYSDGRVISTKYEPQKKYVKDPKVVVFSNWPPKDGKLTRKRVKLYEILDERLKKRNYMMEDLSETFRD